MSSYEERYFAPIKQASRSPSSSRRRGDHDFSPRYTKHGSNKKQDRLSVSAYSYNESNSQEHRDPRPSSRSRDVSLASEEFRQKTLSWRLDPDQSFSDWTLEVTVRNKSSTHGSYDSYKHVERKVYHCHSNVLAWGPRKGDTFAELFQSRLQKDPTNKVSRLELTGQECDAFPLLLDFMYCEKSLPLSPDRACSLYILAETFKVESLRMAIRKHIETGLTIRQMIDFLTFTRKYRVSNELVFFANSKLCSHLVKNPEEVSEVPPDVLVQVLQKRRECIEMLREQDSEKFSKEWEQKRSKSLSIVVAECLDCHFLQDKSVQGSSGTIHFSVTRENLNQMTAKEHLPYIDAEAAVKIIKVSSALAENDESPSNRNDEQLRECLEERCLSSIASNWRTLMKNCRKGTLNGVSSRNNEANTCCLDLNMLLKTFKGFPAHFLANLLILTTVEYESRIQRYHVEAREVEDQRRRDEMKTHNAKGRREDLATMKETLSRPFKGIDEVRRDSRERQHREGTRMAQDPESLLSLIGREILM